MKQSFVECEKALKKSKLVEILQDTLKTAKAAGKAVEQC